MSDSYSYSPNSLLESFQKLQAREEAALAAAAGSAETIADDAALPPPAAKRSKTSPSSFVAAAVQFTATGMPSSQVDGHWALVQEAVRTAAEQGAQLILIPELFLGPYFCQSQEPTLMKLACEDVEHCFIVKIMQQLAKQYSVVLPVSLFERDNNTLYNTVVMVDADGSVLGKYRKSHIPDGVGYNEKFYFSPGDTGFRVWKTRVGNVGVAICWDQWFPEAARAMALQGADILLYPTAIGSEPQDPTLDSSDHWQRVMQGHSAANMIPVLASNRQGNEVLLHPDGSEKQRIRFYGRSFITDATGALVAHADTPNSAEKPYTILTSTIDPEANRSMRMYWGLFRDRRPDLYQVLLTKDGKQQSSS